MSMSPTDIAKAAVSLAVQLKVQQIAENQLKNRTTIDTTTIPVKVATWTVGAVGASLMKPITDTTVEIVSSRIAAWKLNRGTKEDTK